MAKKNYILAIDQGTTSSRAIVFDSQHQKCGIGQREIEQIFPHSGWVEHNPDEIFTSCVSTVRIALEHANLTAEDIATIGITNQRETTIVWDKKTGKAIYNAIVWQDRRTSDACKELIRAGHETSVSEKTGLLLDPYFSATKIAWILDNVDDARIKAEKGELLFGTVDCWLLWNLTKGKVHATDATNASRTMLFNIKTQQWDKELLDLFNIPASLLPEVFDCAADFGISDHSFFGVSIAINGVAGDQQAAALGQACFKPGMLKSTYGTGCFAMLNTGDEIVRSKNRLLTTTAYRLNGKTTYALEGSIFMGGASVQWLRDGLGIIKNASDCDAMAAASDSAQQVYLVPAFTGMGAPYWDAEARGLLCGLSRASGRNEIVRATLEAVGYQTADLLNAMQNDWQKHKDIILRVDGGMTTCNWTMQFLANILNAPVDRPTVMETTALGAAWLAGHYAGAWDNAEGFAKSWELERQFKPEMDETQRQLKMNGWQDAVKRTLSFE